jgi:uncharacterized protein (DUF302 family)
MSYYFSKTLDTNNFDLALEKVTEELKKEGFWILSEIDVQQTLKNKINVDFKKYKILGACNPQFAHKALQNEDKIGVFLPCNVVVEENDYNKIEVSVVDPVASMMSVNNKELEDISTEVRDKLKRVISNL